MAKQTWDEYARTVEERRYAANLLQEVLLEADDVAYLPYRVPFEVTRNTKGKMLAEHNYRDPKIGNDTWERLSKAFYFGAAVAARMSSWTDWSRLDVVENTCLEVGWQVDHHLMLDNHVAVLYAYRDKHYMITSSDHHYWFLEIEGLDVEAYNEAAKGSFMDKSLTFAPIDVEYPRPIIPTKID